MDICIRIHLWYDAEMDVSESVSCSFSLSNPRSALKKCIRIHEDYAHDETIKSYHYDKWLMNNDMKFNI